MTITWDLLEKYQITWADINALGLTWDEIETLSPDNLFEIARQRIPKFQTSDEPLPEETVKTVNVFYNSYPSAVPKKKKWTTSALQLFGTAAVSWAIDKCLDNPEEIACMLLKIASILANLKNR